VVGRGTGERGFRPDIQGLRALAVTTVVIYHLYPKTLPGGFVGVDVFFVISGFLITGHLWRGYQRSGRIRLLDFWGRRAKRLLPAAALVLAVTWFVARAVLPSSQLPATAEQIRASALYYQNWLLAHDAVNYLTAGQAATPVQHFWSLSVEEQFYLVWPLLFVLATMVARLVARRWRPRLVLIALMVVLVAASLAYSVYETSANPSAAYFVTPTRMWELGLGGLLAMLPEWHTGQPGRLTRLVRLGRGGLGWAGLGLVLASPFALRGTTAFPGALALLPVGGAVLFIAGGPEHGPARLVSIRPLVFLGGISYSLYLWHWPVIDLWTAYQGKAPGILSGLVIIVVSVVLAWLTKILVEDPVRQASILSGHGWRSLSTALAVALPAALVSVYIAGIPGQFNGKLGPGYPGAEALASKTLAVRTEPVLPPPDDAGEGVPEYWQQGCLVGEWASAPKECVYGDTTNPTLTVALVGDSVAGNWFPALDEIALRYHWKLVTEVHGVCAFTATWLVKPGTSSTPFTACHQWDVSVLHDLLTSIHPDVVITSDLPEVGSLAHHQVGQQAYADIAAGMANYWTQLENHGISVVPIQETPTISFNPPDCVAKYGASSSQCEEPAAKAISVDPPTVQATRLMDGKVKLIDMNKFVCDRTECPSVIGNVLVYFDGHHLTSNYSKTMAPYLAPQLLSSSAVLASHKLERVQLVQNIPGQDQVGGGHVRAQVIDR
jgi:peptidoglycan/LPS O-acetylase OafA/YrhL